MLPWFLIAVPVAFNVLYATLAARFSYPGILRRPTAEVLERFRAGGAGLIVLWWGFAMSAALFVVIAVLAADLVQDSSLAAVGVAVGVLAALVQTLGLLRWVYLVPHLARAADGADGPTMTAIDLVFQSFHRYLGVAVGEHLGYLTTGTWTVLLGIGVLPVLPGWVGIAGIVIGALLILGAAEFLGPFEREGWAIAGVIVPIAYILWSAWLVTLGVVLLVTSGTS